jgi:hypothetical protein
VFRHRPSEPDPVALSIAEPDVALRDERDPDPIVEEATERLRQELSDLGAVDAWGRPLAWRQVARIALGTLATPRVRDALTAEALADAVQRQGSVSPDGSGRAEEWRSFFRSVDDNDRLLGHQSRSLPQ